jgi:hypothetical protein
MATKFEFPNDENGDVLRRMQEDGDDLSKSRDVDFTVIFADKSRADAFSKKIQNHGYKTSVEETASNKALPWDVVVVKHMVPTHADITNFEGELTREAEPLGGRNDGWGSFAQ